MALNEKKLRVGVIGLGFAGRTHIRSARLAGADVIGIADVSADRADAAAKSLGVPRAYESPTDLIEASDADLIHVCTPNAFHFRYAEAALLAGKHVICEKPLATSVAEGTRLLELSRSRRRVATVPYVYRYHPMVREARERVRQGELGRLYLIHGSYLQDWLLESTDTNWRVRSSVNGPSRAFADIGTHWCDLIEWVTGQRFTEVQAVLATTLPERLGHDHQETFGNGSGRGGKQEAVDTEDLACLLLRTDSGTVGSLTVSQVSAGHKNRLWFELDGSRESLRFNQENSEYLEIGTRESTQIIRRDPTQGSAEQRRLATLPAGHAQGWGDCFEAFVRDTYSAVNGAASDDLPTFAAGLRSIHLIDTVLRASRQPGWYSVPEAGAERGCTP